MESRPELQAPPEVFYNDDEARKYTSSSRIIDIQAKLSERALELLALPDDGVPRLLLDIGCGSGLSGETLTENGHHWIGLDISESMLNIALEREAEGDLIHGDMGQGLGVRPGVIDGAVSISAVQWLCNADKSSHEPRLRLKAFFGSLYRCLARGARAVLQVYPENLAQRELMLGVAMRSGFSGGVVVDFPHSTKSRKEFLVLTCGQASLASVTPKSKGEDGESCPDDEESSGDEENHSVFVSDRHRPRKKQKMDSGEDDGEYDFPGKDRDEEIENDSEEEDEDGDGEEDDEEGSGEDSEEGEQSDKDVEKGEELEELEKEYKELQNQEQDIWRNLKNHKDEDIQKGQAVKNQRALWDKTLEFRFLLQKPFSSCKRLQEEQVKSLYCKADNEVSEAYSDVIASSKKTLDSILELQQALITNNPSITRFEEANSARDSKQLDAQASSNGSSDEEWLQISQIQSRMNSFRNKSIDKWHRKAQVTTGAAAIKDKLHAFNQSISEQVAAYMRDPSKMIKGMQQNRSAVAVFGNVPSYAENVKPEESLINGDPELLDDSEFYQQLLKEFFETVDPSSSETAFYALKRLQMKKRKIVDRRASKSRKIRYNVHEKIVNFMAPRRAEIPPTASRLFENLFGLKTQKSAS